MLILNYTIFEMISGLQTRLVGGSCPSEGRVEVNYNGDWGTVCNDDWGIDDANVVCKSLGYPSALSENPQPTFGPGSDMASIILDDLVCTGEESNIAYCGHNGYGKHNCDHSEDAGVICEKGIFILTVSADLKSLSVWSSSLKIDEPLEVL